MGDAPFDLELDESAAFIAQSVRRFCRERADLERVKRIEGFCASLWSEFTELGFLALGSPDGEGGVQEIVAAMEALGEAAFVGPLVESYVAVAALDDPELRAGVIEGRHVVSMGRAGRMPLVDVADVWLELRGEGLWRAHAASAPGEVRVSLSGQRVAALQLDEGRELPAGPRALRLGEIALSAQLAALARGLLGRCAEHVAHRKQFGRAVGSFQAVAHPLADCEMALAAAESLARAAACRFDVQGHQAAGELAAAAVLSSRRAALQTAYTCHQKFGAIGITLEGPAHHVTRLIRSLASRELGTATQGQRLLEALDPERT